jgi:S-methylmethionine-dependent homocysteine/selenocysteine methylase
MAKYRTRLPQLGERAFLTDGGLETTLIFNQGWKLPYLEAFTLVDSEHGRAAILAYYEPYLTIALRSGCGFVLESPTWRANPDWAGRVGYDRKTLELANRTAIALMERLRATHQTDSSPMPISGCIGPRGDGYDSEDWMSANEAQAYHTFQVEVLADTEADMITAMTMTNINEAIGIVRAAQQAKMPVVVSFTVEEDGRLPSGETLKDAIVSVDGATRHGPAYYMINCAHPTHFSHLLVPGEAWTERVHGVRASAAAHHNHVECMRDPDAGNPAEFGQHYRDLMKQHPSITVLGGCCGTDHVHIEQIGLGSRAAA